jgi:predicted hotdog family 3-hydroxylacyl-ACP dehydratase
MTMQAVMPRAEAVVPHRGDALLLDRIVGSDDTHLVASMTVRRETAFSDPAGDLPGWVAPEIMAQAIAALAGCRSLRERGYAVPLGLLLGVRHLHLEVEAFRPGQEIRVEVVCTSSDEEGRGVFDCRLQTDAGVVAAATLTAFQPSEPEVLQSLLESA